MTKGETPYYVLEKDSKWPSLLFEHAGKVDATFDVGSVGAKGPRFLLAAASQTSAKRMRILRELACSFKCEWLIVLFGPCAMSDLSPECAQGGRTPTPLTFRVQPLGADDYAAAVLGRKWPRVSW
jgi:hypothetical protein